MQSSRKLMVTLVACGLGLGVLGGAQVNTRMNPGPDLPFRWADGSLPPAQSMRFADSVPLELDVPEDFQLASAEIAGDPAPTHRTPHLPAQGEWAALQLSAYKVDVPAPLPERPRDANDAAGTGSAAGAARLAAIAAGAAIDEAAHDLDPAPQPGNPAPDDPPSAPIDAT